MSIQTATPGVLRWRVLLDASPAIVYDLIATDRGRERFWAESSRRAGGAVLLTFPDGSSTTMDVLDEDPPRRLVVRYFEVQTTFDIESAAADGRSTVLEVTASDVPKDDVVELAAGWVSVLLNLKAAVNFDCDLRNHNREMTWRAGFVDN